MKKAVLIEDEERSRKVLKSMIASHVPDIDIVGEAGTVEEGITVINKSKPDILFLDVQLKGGTGFDILEAVDHSTMYVIFTTAYDNYALRAFKYSAIDYLLKPIIIDELVSAIEKLKTQEAKSQQYKIENLISNLRRPHQEPPVLLISTVKNIEFISVSDILRCQADGAYSKVYMKDGSHMMVSKVIKEFEYLLNDYGFFRVHQSHLINMQEIKKFVKGENVIIMKDGKEIQVAKSRKEGFFKEVEQISL